MNNKIAIVLSLLIISLFSCEKQTEWNVKDYGALDDNKTLNTEAIQKAIDLCSKAGGGTVTLDGGTFISGTLLLKSNVNLNITENTVLLASVNPNDFPVVDPFIDATGQFRGQCFIGAIDVDNVSISGKGTINGQGEMFTPKNVKKTIEKLGIEIKIPDFSSLISKDSKYVNNNIRYSNRPF